jgi:plastocyanin
VLFAGAAVCGFVSAARASQPTVSRGPTTASQSTTTIQIVDYAFSPATVTVAPQTTVVFRNQGVATHRVVADDDAFDSHGIQPGQAWSLTVGGPATIAYHDEIYPTMRGTIVVSATTTAATNGDPFAPSGGSTATTPTTTGATAPPTTATTSLASTGTGDTPLLAFTALLLLVLGGAALALSRPAPVRLVALTARPVDDLLPARDRARR